MAAVAAIILLGIIGNQGICGDGAGRMRSDRTALGLLVASVVMGAMLFIVLASRPSDPIGDTIDRLSLDQAEVASLQRFPEVAGADSPGLLVFKATGDPRKRAKHLADELQLDPTHVVFDSNTQGAIDAIVKRYAGSASTVASGESRGRLFRVIVIDGDPPHVALVVTPGASDW